jgi:hypothetical protein
MSARRLTRRSLLAGGAGVLAAGAAHPAAVLAALAPPPRPTLDSRSLGRLAAGRPRTVQLSRLADLVGLSWVDAPSHSTIELRYRDARGAWSRWVAAGARGHGPDATDAARSHVGEPIWTGGSSAVQVRTDAELSDVSLHLIDVSAGAGARREALARSAVAALSSGPARATPVLAAGPGQPAILARHGWAQGMARPRVAPGYGSVRMAFVHHTENPNGYAAGEVPAMLRAIYAFHRYVNGWDDIGYNFVVDLYGRIFEARAGGIDEPVVGAHAGGYNLVSTGVAVLGSFMGTPISTPARRALERLLAWKLSLHGLPAEGKVAVRVNPEGAVYSRFPANARVSLPHISGHRDGDSTDCPGDALYRELPAIRNAVARLAPMPVRLTLVQAPAPAVAPAPVQPAAPTAPSQPGARSAPSPSGAPTGVAGGETQATSGAAVTLSGTLSHLGGAPIAAAQILIQARSVAGRGERTSEHTLGEASTDAQGAFSLPASFAALPRGAAWLRALYLGSAAGGASVSAPLRVALATPVSAPPATPAPSAPGPAPPAP